MKGEDAFSEAVEDHVASIAERVAGTLDEETRNPVRRFVEFQLRELVRTLDADRARAAQIAAEIGLLERVEQARNAELAGMAPDDALLLLQIGWDDVARELVRVDDAQTRVKRSVRCPRCGATMEARLTRSSKPGSLRESQFRRVGTSEIYRSQRCPECGFLKAV